MKQTAVEWLQEQFRAFGTITDSNDEKTHQLISSAINMCEQAKQMEKEQLAQAWDDGNYNYFYNKKTGVDFEDGTEYYNTLFSSKSK